MASENYHQLLAKLSENNKILFASEYNARRKDVGTAYILMIFLGFFGAHRFYIGEIFSGIMSILFCWTFIPLLICFLELFWMKHNVIVVNNNIADEIYNNLAQSTE